MSESLRIVLATRAPRPAYALVVEAEAFVVTGVPLLPARRIALREVYGLEHAGAWLWIGAGIFPVLLGGADVPAERLASVAAELRARIAALPGGAGRIARIDARAALEPSRPWLTAALVAAFALLFAFTPAQGDTLRFVTNLLLLVSVGLVAEPWLGARRVLVSGAFALLAAGVAAPSGISSVLAPLAPALGWASLLCFLRLRRESVLSVRARSACDGGLLLALAIVLHALSVAGVVPVAGAALAGLLVAPLLLTRWPDA